MVAIIHNCNIQNSDNAHRKNLSAFASLLAPACLCEHQARAAKRGGRQQTDAGHESTTTRGGVSVIGGRPSRHDKIIGFVELK